MTNKGLEFNIYTSDCLSLLGSELRNTLAVCNNSLETRIKNAIKANMFKTVEVLTPHNEPFSIARIGDDLVITDNRELKIVKTNNIFSKLINYINNTIMLIKENYGII